LEPDVRASVAIYSNSELRYCTGMLKTKTFSTNAGSCL